MAIKAYVGRMGSGKTYEVVTEVILGALRNGRRVVSNIAGLNYEAMKAFLVGEGIPEDLVGELVSIDHAKVSEPTFWRTDKDVELGIEAFIQPGDVLALDEIWRFWNGFSTKDDDGKKRPDRVMNFFRMHRHFTHPETGIACDVALITQDPMDLSRQIRSVVEETYYMEKLTAIGSTKRYRVDIFQGGRMSRRPLRQLQRSYNSELFCLYSSHSQKKEGHADAREENIDKRGNIFQGALFRVVLPLGLVVGGFAVWNVYKFFKPPESKPAISSASAPGPVSALGTAAAPSMPLPPKPISPTYSDEWRVVGYVQHGGAFRILLSDGQVPRLLSPASFNISAVSLETALPSGVLVSTWSGRRGGGMLDSAMGVKR